MENSNNKYFTIIDKMDAEIDRNEAKRLIMDLLAAYNFSDTTPDFKERCFIAVFYALELMSSD
ncbi:MAG: hypothetical protein JNL70_13045 [Saprospiraceae bacterium]|nr:hypothetical protein [Saprospiraceae bacterium]